MDTCVQNPNERRRSSRVNLNADVTVTVCFNNGEEEQIKGKILNLSREGAAVLLPAEISAETKIALTIYSNDDQSVCSGEVLWNREHRAQVVHGIRIARWSYLDPHIAWQLKAAI